MEATHSGVCAPEHGEPRAPSILPPALRVLLPGPQPAGPSHRSSYAGPGRPHLTPGQARTSTRPPQPSGARPYSPASGAGAPGPRPWGLTDVALAHSGAMWSLLGGAGRSRAALAPRSFWHLGEPVPAARRVPGAARAGDQRSRETAWPVTVSVFSRAAGGKCVPVPAAAPATDWVQGAPPRGTRAFGCFRPQGVWRA